MSWQVTPIEPSTGANIDAAIEVAQLWGTSAPEHQQQLDAAKWAAKAMIASGALGNPGDGRLFIVSLNGHANPDHEPVPGWANDAITVSVRSEPADSDAARIHREHYERYVAQKQAEAEAAQSTQTPAGA